jgi:hypothetical protein
VFWDWRSQQQMDFPAVDLMLIAADNCRFCLFWEIARTTPKAHGQGCRGVSGMWMSRSCAPSQLPSRYPKKG